MSELEGRSMNADIDWKKILECRLAGLMAEIIMRILLQKMDAKSVFQQMGIAPDQAAAFSYRLEDLILFDIRL